MQVKIHFFCNANPDINWNLNWTSNQPLVVPEVGDSASMHGHGRFTVESRFFNYSENGVTVELGLAYPKIN